MINYIYIFLCVCGFMCVCVCVYTYIQIHTIYPIGFVSQENPNTVIWYFCKFDIIFSTLQIRNMKILQSRCNLKFTWQMGGWSRISIQAFIISKLKLCHVVTSYMPHTWEEKNMQEILNSLQDISTQKIFPYRRLIAFEKSNISSTHTALSYFPP